ncbi:MAG: hypothetical protein ACP5XB_10915 [Isosphaeraceae bacterium]
MVDSRFIFLLALSYLVDPPFNMLSKNMDAASLSRVEGIARSAPKDPIDSQESRLWDRARFNLMLLYGGRRGGDNNAQGTTAIMTGGAFATVDLDI